MKRKQSSPSRADPDDEALPSKKAKTDSGFAALAEEQTGEEWTKVERRKGKKAKKAQMKNDARPPRFFYSNGDIIKRKEAVGISDVRELVLHIIGDAPPVSWLKVENPQAIQKVVALLIPGLTPDLLQLSPLPTSATSNPNIPLSIPLQKDASGKSTSDIPFIPATFSHACPTRAPGDSTRMHSVMASFFQGPVSGTEKKKQILQRVTSERKLEKSPERYLMTPEQLVENEYPIPSYLADVFQKSQGWVETPNVPAKSLLSEEQPKSAVYAIDCEMCLTEDGKELTRVCMIDYYTEKVVFDQLVKPAKPVIDYLTRWSGITQKALDPVTTTLADVQNQLLPILNQDPIPILLGHSVESDLKALKLCHPRCIDTAVIYHHPRGRPLKPGLAWLTKKWCGREIQNRGEGGHDPEEDARACLQLLKKKVENGPGFGEFKTDQESIFERLGRASGHFGVGKILTAVVDHGNPVAWHGAKANTAIACKSDEDVFNGLMETFATHHFLFGRFNSVADALGWITPKGLDGPPQSALPAAPPTPTVPPLDFKTTLTQLNSYLTRLHEALPPRTALVVFTGHSDPRRMAALNARKIAFENALRAGKTSEMLDTESRWSSADGRELEEEVEKAKRGLLMLCMKEQAAES